MRQKSDNVNIEKEDFQIFSEKISEIALFFRLNQMEVAEKIGISNAMLYAYKAGKIKISNKAWKKIELVLSEIESIKSGKKNDFKKRSISKPVHLADEPFKYPNNFYDYVKAKAGIMLNDTGIGYIATHKGTTLLLDKLVDTLVQSSMTFDALIKDAEKQGYDSTAFNILKQDSILGINIILIISECLNLGLKLDKFIEFIERYEKESVYKDGLNVWNEKKEVFKTFYKMAEADYEKEKQKSDQE